MRGYVRKRRLCKEVVGLLLAGLLCCVSAVVAIDPYFHYHKPLTSLFYYRFGEDRSVNDGIIRRFAYDGLLIGTSMIENTDASQVEEAYGGRFAKVAYPGGTFLEIDRAIQLAVRTHPNLHLVVRSLDTSHLLDAPDRMRYPPEEMPTYLYDHNLLNDAFYVFNLKVQEQCAEMVLGRLRGESPGIESFDEYGNWMNSVTSANTGPSFVLADKTAFVPPVETNELDDAKREQVIENYERNVLATIRENPEIEFYFFLPPYSVAWWMKRIERGNFAICRAAEQELLVRLLTCENAHVYGYQNLFDVTTDLNNYRDDQHYVGSVNELIVQKMAAGEGELTLDNYEAYLDETYGFYERYDYASLFE